MNDDNTMFIGIPDENSSGGASREKALSMDWQNDLILLFIFELMLQKGEY
jgi:hypothetical protein